MINLAIKIKMSGTIDSPYRVLVITKPTRTGSASTAPSSGSATVPAPASFGGSGDESSDEDFFDASDMTLLTTASVPARPTTAPTLSLPALSVVSDDSVPIVPIFDAKREIEEASALPASPKSTRQPSRQIQALGDDSTDDDMPDLEETLDFQNADTLEESEGTPARMAEDLRRNKIREKRLPRRKENVQKIKRFASKSPKTQQRITEGKFRKEQLEQKVQMKRQKREEKRERRLADRASTTEVGYTFH